MSRINTNVSSLIAQRVLSNNNTNLNTSLERLSTGVRINRGKDDPAGLIAANALKSEIGSLNAAVGNAERADQVVSIAEGGLQEVSGLLTELQGLLTSSANTAGLSSSEKEANQLQIDSILQTIDRISNSTSFQGTQLLNGGFDFTTSSVNSGVSDFSVNGANFTGSSQNVDVVVTQSAQQGGLFLSFGAANLNLGGTGASDGATSAFVLEIGGALGSREISFGSGTTLSDVASTINSFTDVTGVTASASGTGISLFSEEYGSDEFVSVQVKDEGGLTTSNTGIYSFQAADGNAVDTSSGSLFNAAANTNGRRDTGQDLVARINGTTAQADGRSLSVNTDTLNVDLTLTEGQATQVSSFTAFSITGGGASFQLGSNIDLGSRVSVGIGNFSTRNLGNSTAGFLDDLRSGSTFDVTSASSDDLDTAQKVIGAAIDQVSSTRGRLGAFQRNTVGATIRNLGVAIENTEAARSQIFDADFAQETAALTRNQILVQASTNILSLANQNPQNALQLLG